jgi:hypothetical protein
VLGGRAVQDIWIVPGRGQPDEGRPPLGFHGSTIRFYGAAIGAWSCTYQCVLAPARSPARRSASASTGSRR